MKFESKKDPWVSALIWGGIVIMALGTIQVVHDALVADSSGADVITAFLLGALLMGSGGIMLWVYFGTNYTLASDRLLIRSGPFRWEIKYTDIKEIRPTRNPLSSPALSLDRLAIRRHTSSIAVMISPLDREAFLRAVRERVPGLEVGLD